MPWVCALSAAGVVAALAAEARTLGSRTRRSDGLYTIDNGTLVAVSGMGGAAAAAAAAKLVDAGACALVSWGMAGGLDPALPAGTICLPRVVVSIDGTSCVTDLHWREILTAAITARRVVANGQLLTGEAVIGDVANKAAAHRDTGCVAVDMESWYVGQVAASRGIPFIAVRVIVDTALDTIPSTVLAASRGGSLQLPSLLLGVLRTPRDIAPLLRLARRYRSARQSLVAVARTGALAPLANQTQVSRIA